jgi:ribosome-interacting GTPase 1
MLEYENIQIQLLDTPPLAAGSTLPILAPNLVRADALLVVIGMSEDPLLQMETITSELGEMRISIGSRRSDEEQEEVRYPKKALVIASKIDLDEGISNYSVLSELLEGELPIIAVSAVKGTGLEELKQELFRMLDIIRVYTKTPGQKPDMSDPIVLPKGSTLEDAAIEVHKDFKAKLKFARIWGSGKHDGVRVKRDHVLQDGDIIELHM